MANALLLSCSGLRRKSQIFIVILISVLTFTSFPVFSQSAAGTEIANITSWLANAAGEVFAKSNAGDTITRDAASRSVTVKTPVDYRAASGRVFNLLVEKTAQVASTRMGTAVIGFARGATIGSGIGAAVILGATAVSLLCSETQICQKSGTDDLQVSGSEYGDFGYTGIGVSNAVEQACSSPKDKLNYFSFKASSGGSVTYGVIVQDKSTACSSKYGSQGYTFAGNCAADNSCGVYPPAVYYKILSSPYAPPEQPHPPTAEDWAAAETKIISPDWDQILIDKGVPLPTTKPLLQPMIQTLSDDTTTDRDAAGNVTGTTKTVTTVTLQDTATDTRPGSVSATETTVKTTSNAAGETTGTQTTSTTSPPPDKPLPPINIILDTVEDTEIQTKTVEAPLNTNTWGEGTCPAPIPINTSFNTYTIPTEQLCDFAVGARPMILLVAGVTSLMIVAGFKL